MSGSRRDARPSSSSRRDVTSPSQEQRRGSSRRLGVDDAPPSPSRNEGSGSGRRLGETGRSSSWRGLAVIDPPPPSPSRGSSRNLAVPAASRSGRRLISSAGSRRDVGGSRRDLTADEIKQRMFIDAEAGLAPGWRAVWSRSREKYYWASDSGETTWNKPYA